MLGHTHSNTKVFLQVLQGVLSDECFKIGTSLATQALESADLLFKWCSRPENREIVSTFTTSLINDLSSALDHDNCKNMTARRERMWGTYHDIRTSEHFRSTWCSFIQASIGCSSNPILYQYITDQIFSEMIVQVTNTNSIKSCHNDHPLDLTYEEKNALRYAGGYVCKKLQKNCQSTIKYLITNESDVGDSSEWVTMIDRGGLVHINESTYKLFEAMEMVVRCKLKCDRQKLDILMFKSCILNDDDVMDCWRSLGVDEDFSEPSLLERISDLWIKIRGFSYASSFMELYKQHTKKSLQRVKPLRKGLNK